jgi:hypothetical protein
LVVSEPTDTGYGPKDFETVRRIPLAIRERVWGGEGVLAGLNGPKRVYGTRDDRSAMQAAMLRLRAAERRRGALYGVRPRTLETATIDAETLKRIRQR